MNRNFTKHSRPASGQKLLSTFLAHEKPNFEHCVESLSQLFPLLLQFSSTPQDSQWHAEGDVHIHTSMVLQVLYRELDSTEEELSEDEKVSLFLAALLHDIAKPLTTTQKEIQGVMRTISPKHEERGRSIIGQPLLELGLSYRVVRDVMALVGYHQLPKFMAVKMSPARDYRKLARLAPMRLLYLLERADMIGRHCSDIADQLTYLDLFKLEAQSLGLWGKAASPVHYPYFEWSEEIKARFPKDSPAFIDLALGESIFDHESGLITEVSEGIARSFSRRQGFASLYVLVGASGVGKSTWVKQSMPEATVVSLDDLRGELALGGRLDQESNGQVLQEAKKRLREALATHKTVVWDATSLRVDFRRPLIDLGRSYGALVTVVVFHRPTKDIQSGNAARSEAVPPRVLEEQFARMQWPEEDEAHRFVVIGESGHELYRAGFIEDSQKIDS